MVNIIVENLNEIEQYNIRTVENRTKIDKQHEETIHVIELMKQGFENVDKRFESVDKRFEELIHYMDKRFDDVNNKFKLLTWIIGIGFGASNIFLVVLLKIFSN